MYPDELVFGVTRAPSAACDPSVTRKLRDLTISWSRYDYRGRILDGETIEHVLEQAAELGYRWCLVQSPGHIILEHWHADERRKRFDHCVSEWIRGRDFLAVAVDGDDACLLVDVGRWGERGRQGIRPELVEDLGAALEGQCLSLDERSVAPFVGEAIRHYPGAEARIDPRTGAFLAEVQQQVVSADRGVFLWNLEPYDDVRTPPRGFEPPISTLYSVASGFKPNVLLESLGFDADTRVVFFDCSTKALEVKRLLLDEWDGRDFPAFVRDLFRRLPAPDAHYHLWDGATPATIGDRAIAAAWERELEQWGGEQAFAEHWSRYRRVRHEFVRCDVLRGAGSLVERIEPEPNAVIWWSNAFFSVWGNWLLDADERKRRYREWVEGLAERNPDLFLYGSDFSNSSVNDVQAADYRAVLRDADCDEFVPLAANAYEIRF